MEIRWYRGFSRPFVMMKLAFYFLRDFLPNTNNKKEGIKNE